jgi:hypothetical protein
MGLAHWLEQLNNTLRTTIKQLPGARRPVHILRRLSEQPHYLVASRHQGSVLKRQ